MYSLMNVTAFLIAHKRPGNFNLTKIFRQIVCHFKLRKLFLEIYFHMRKNQQKTQLIKLYTKGRVKKQQ